MSSKLSTDRRAEGRQSRMAWTRDGWQVADTALHAATSVCMRRGRWRRWRRREEGVGT